jgi:hypothetical protein
MKFQYTNLLKTSTLTVSSSSPATPKSFLFDQYLSNFLLFTGKTEETILIDAGAGNTITINSIGLAGFNFTSSVVLTLQGNDSNTWTAPSFTETITYKSGVITQFLDSSETYKYFRLKIEDPTNTENLQIGYMFLGLYVDAPGFDPYVNITDNVNSVVNVTPGGQVSGSINYEYRTVSVKYPIITSTERDQLRQLFCELKNYTVLFVTIWEESLEIEKALFCVINQNSLSMTKNKLTTFSANLSFREAK